jgi:hypothetical protein
MDILHRGEEEAEGGDIADDVAGLSGEIISINSELQKDSFFPSQLITPFYTKMYVFFWCGIPFTKILDPPLLASHVG